MKHTHVGTKRAAAHYIWALVVMSIYGGLVCPYVDSLGVAHWLAVLGMFFGITFALRPLIVRKFVLSSPFDSMAGAHFKAEGLVFVVLGATIMLFNFFNYNFPLGSGVKILTGVAMLGFFAAADMALERQRLITEHLGSIGQHVKPSEKHFSITGKFMLLSTVSIAFITVVFFLVISKDLHWLSETAQSDPPKARLAVLMELLFIGSVVLAGVFNLMLSYSKNLRIFLDNENSTLKAASGGDLTREVTVSTNDEFGVMGWYTNKMIADLRTIIDRLHKTQDATIHSLASLAEIRDMETGRHIVRTKFYVKALAERMAMLPKYKGLLTPEYIRLLCKSAPLHDVGKVGIPDSVLLKPGRLTPEEFGVMKKHPVFGRDAMREAEKILGDSSFLRLAAEIAYSHHEKWNGSGYPEGLKGEDIPLSGRLMALADVYDALVFKRVYKPAISHEETRGIIVGDSGTHFDPEVVEAFLAVQERFKDIARDYGEEAEDVHIDELDESCM